MEWLLEHKETILAVVAFLVAGFKAWKRGKVAAFLVSKVEGLATKEDREAIKADAVKAGVEKVLAPVVKKVTKGDKGGIVGILKGLVLPCLAFGVLMGCAAPSAGTATTPVTVDLSRAWLAGGATTTITVTITPTSEAKQEAKADAKVDATVPIR